MGGITGTKSICKGKKRQKKSKVQVLETRPVSPCAPAVIHQPRSYKSNPPIQVASEPFYIRWIERDPLSLFLRFFWASSLA